MKNKKMIIFIAILFIIILAFLLTAEKIKIDKCATKVGLSKLGFTSYTREEVEACRTYLQEKEKEGKFVRKGSS